LNFFVDYSSSFPTVYGLPLPSCGEKYFLIYASGSETQGVAPEYGDEAWYARGVWPLSFSTSAIALPDETDECWSAEYLSSFRGQVPDYASYTDENGCVGQIELIDEPVIEPPQIQILNVVGSCANDSVGQATMLITGGSVLNENFYSMEDI